MSFQLNCPNCGKRAVSEFTFKVNLKIALLPMQIFRSGQIMYISVKTTWDGKSNGGITETVAKAGS
jgi:sarcosine oxidase delta subunit